jgi:DNA-3-methyladenine glycosylase II
MTPAPAWQAAEKHLHADPILRRIKSSVGPCQLRPRKDHFVLLCRAIYSQQISSKVARVLFARFSACFPGKRPTPQRVLDLLTSQNIPKGIGLSRQKTKYLIDLSKHFLDGRIPKRLTAKTDDQIIEALTAVNGIGRWTAEMFLIFVLNRPDVWPIGDLGLRLAVQRHYKLKKHPTPRQMTKMAQSWRPYRTVASWYLWRAVDGEGDSDEWTKASKKKA